MSVQTKLDRAAVVTQSPDQVSCELDGQVVLMSVGQGSYYRIDEIGSRIWSMIAAPLSIQALCDRLLTEFEVSPETCEADVLAFLNDLLEDDLIQVVDHGEMG